MAKLNPLGIGPRIAAISLPFLALVVAANIMWPGVFTLAMLPSAVTVPLGVLFLVAFVVWYAATARTLLPGLKRGELVTSGPFRLCQNPLYASFILLLVPGHLVRFLGIGVETVGRLEVGRCTALVDLHSGFAVRPWLASSTSK